MNSNLRDLLNVINNVMSEADNLRDEFDYVKQDVEDMEVQLSKIEDVCNDDDLEPTGKLNKIMELL